MFLGGPFSAFQKVKNYQLTALDVHEAMKIDSTPSIIYAAANSDVDVAVSSTVLHRID